MEDKRIEIYVVKKSNKQNQKCHQTDSEICKYLLAGVKRQTEENHTKINDSSGRDHGANEQPKNIVTQNTYRCNNISEKKQGKEIFLENQSFPNSQDSSPKYKTSAFVSDQGNILKINKSTQAYLCHASYRNKCEGIFAPEHSDNEEFKEKHCADEINSIRSIGVMTKHIHECIGYNDPDERRNYSTNVYGVYDICTDNGTQSNLKHKYNIDIPELTGTQQKTNVECASKTDEPEETEEPDCTCLPQEEETENKDMFESECQITQCSDLDQLLECIKQNQAVHEKDMMFVIVLPGTNTQVENTPQTEKIMNALEDCECSDPKKCELVEVPTAKSLSVSEKSAQTLNSKRENPIVSEDCKCSDLKKCELVEVSTEKTLSINKKPAINNNNRKKENGPRICRDSTNTSKDCGCLVTNECRPMKVPAAKNLSNSRKLSITNNSKRGNELSIDRDGTNKNAYTDCGCLVSNECHGMIFPTGKILSTGKNLTTSNISKKRNSPPSGRDGTNGYKDCECSDHEVCKAARARTVNNTSANHNNNIKRRNAPRTGEESSTVREDYECLDPDKCRAAKALTANTPKNNKSKRGNVRRTRQKSTTGSGHCECDPEEWKTVDVSTKEPSNKKKKVQGSGHCECLEPEELKPVDVSTKELSSKGKKVQGSGHCECLEPEEWKPVDVSRKELSNKGKKSQKYRRKRKIERLNTSALTFPSDCSCSDSERCHLLGIPNKARLRYNKKYKKPSSSSDYSGVTSATLRHPGYDDEIDSSCSDEDINIKQGKSEEKKTPSLVDRKFSSSDCSTRYRSLQCACPQNSDCELVPISRHNRRKNNTKYTIGNVDYGSKKRQQQSNCLCVNSDDRVDRRRGQKYRDSLEYCQQYGMRDDVERNAPPKRIQKMEEKKPLHCQCTAMDNARPNNYDNECLQRPVQSANQPESINRGPKHRDLVDDDVHCRCIKNTNSATRGKYNTKMILMDLSSDSDRENFNQYWQGICRDERK